MSSFGEQETSGSLTRNAPAARTPLRVGDSFVLLVPLLQVVQFHSVGILFASDVLLLAAFPLVLARRAYWLRKKQVMLILSFGLAWLFAQVVTDLIRGAQPEDYLRGWSKIGLTLTHFAVICGMLRDSKKRFMLYGVGVSAGGVLSSYLYPNDLVSVDPWKFGFALSITFGVVLVACLLSNRRWTSFGICALVGMSGVNLFMNYRSMGLICLVAAGYSYFRMHMHDRRKQIGKLQIAVVASAVLLSVVGFQKVYELSIEAGWLGSAARAKFESQQGGEGGVLLGGRSEILSSFQAILDSPIIGHGSWARDPKYAALMRERMAELGYKNGFDDGNDLIPAHSHIFGAWVESGIVGAFFWFWILKLVVTALWRVAGTEPLLPVFAFMAFLLCWDIMFSPYGAERRFLTTYFIAGIVLIPSFRRQESSVSAGALNC